MTYRPEVDGLRAVAVLAVLVYHASGLLPGGFAGVDVFFVISGYVITRAIAGELDRDAFTIAGFYERRIRRIAPALFLTILLTSVGAWFVLLPPDLASFGKSAIAATLMVSNVLFWMQSGYFDAAAQAKPLLHTWSLGIEEQFYLLYPLLFAWLWRRTRTAIAPALAVTAAVSLAAAVWAVSADASTGFYLAPFRFWELLLGALVALRPAQRLTGTPFALAGVGMIVAAYVAYDVSTPFPGLPALLPTIGAALVINAARSGTVAARALGAPPLVFIGKISYSLYLIHWPLIVLLEYRQGALLGPWQAAGVIAASIALATLSWRFIEQPFRNRRGEHGRPRLAFGSAIVAGMAPCLVGLAFLVTKGAPSRLPPEVLAVYAASADRWFEGKSCFMDTKGTRGPTPDDVRAGRLCVVGDPNRDTTPDFLIWGDSHAAATTPAIAEAADRDDAWGLSVGAGACPPLKAFDVLDAKDAVDRRCAANNAAVLDYLRSARIPVVFMVARWPKYALGNEFGDESYFFDPNKIPPPVPGEDAKLAAALDATLAELRGIGVKPVLVMAVPEPGYDVPYAYARALLQGKKPNVAPSPEWVTRRQARAREILTTAAEKYGAEIIDPNAALCPGGACKVDVGGTPIYRDSDHLTLTAAKSISYIFDELFRRAVHAGSGAAGVR